MRGAGSNAGADRQQEACEVYTLQAFLFLSFLHPSPGRTFY
jgi:hypothetical protein